MANKNIKNNNGITLIALVITIIIILILVGVSINQIFGDDGLIDRSSGFAENTNAIMKNQTEEVDNKIDELDDVIHPCVQNKTIVTKKLKRRNHNISGW